MNRGNREAVLVLVGALGIWLGLQALRAFLAMVVWNVGEDMDSTQMGLIALGVFAVGLIAWWPTRWFGGARPMLRFGFPLAALGVLRQALPGEWLSPAFAFVTIVAWLWWFPAYLQELNRRALPSLAVPAILLGLTGLVAEQAMLHGLTLPFLRGLGSIAGAALLAGLFAAAVRFAGQEELPQGVAPAPVWGALALGPFTFLQITLLTNAGWMQVLSGRELFAASAVMLAGLFLALVSLAWKLPHWTRWIWPLAAAGLLVPGESLQGMAVLALIPVQVALAQSLRWAFQPGGGQTGAGAGRTYAAFAGGQLLMFVLSFVFYSQNTWPLLWVPAALLAGLAGWRGAPAGIWADRRAWMAAAGLMVLGLGLHLIPAAGTAGAAPLTGKAPAELKVLNYNIHNGFDYWSVPAMQVIADEIRKADADLVALQEVSRSWNVSGAVDMVAFLKWRLPEYHFSYGPMNGPTWGNLILSKYPITAAGVVYYPMREAPIKRGLMWATIPTEAGDLLFANTHYTAYEGYEQERTEQSGDVLAWWQGRERTLLVGDFNAHPEHEAIRRLLGAGFRDLPAEHGLGQTYTYSAVNPYERLDYIFSTQDIAATSARVGSTTASDHLPVFVTIKLR